MPNIMKVFLLLAVMVCIAKAQHNESGQHCLCQRVRKPNGVSQIKDIQIYPATIFCDRVEIVVTNDSGFRYCLNPKLNAVKKLLAKIMSQRITSTATPADINSTPAGTNTPRI